MNRTFLIVGLTVFILILFFTINGSQKETIKSRQVISKPSLKAEVKNGRYIDYDKEAFNNAAGKKRVYFFHAKWCPTCKAANEEFIQNIDKIPEDVMLFKTDYDTEKELKTQYGITYQHTFVLVDNEGKEIRKWNGGGITELINNIANR